MTHQSQINHKRIYEFMTLDEFHGKPIASITSRAVWEGFQTNTTAHGIPHVRNARGPVKTGFWLLMSLTSCALLIFYAYFLFDKYFQYNVTVKVEVVSLPRMKFPAVTVCNHNPIRKNKVIRLNNPALRRLFGYNTDDTNDDEDTQHVAPSIARPVPTPPAQIAGQNQRNNHGSRPGSVNNPIPTQASTLHQMAPTEQSRTDIYGGGQGLHTEEAEDRSGKVMSKELETFITLQEIVAELSMEEAREIGYPSHDFILDCEYSGAYCYSSDFESKYYNPTYGNCFTFNLGGDNTTELQDSYRPGPRYGLAITFNVDEDEYYGPLVQEAGVRIVIHSQDTMPFPEDEGISVLPGQITYVGVRKFEVERLSEPYSSCEQIHNLNQKRNVYEEHYGVKYSTKACFKTCYQYHVITQCGCADPAYPRHGKGEGPYPPCKISDDEKGECIEQVLAGYQDETLGCDCPTACSESTYTTTTSAAAWPTSDYRHSLFEKLASQNNKVIPVLNSEEDSEKYKDNLLKAVIYFEEFNYERVDEVASYQSFSLVSDLGGILGLFIGFSVMTIVEFLELGLDLVLLNVLKRYRSKTSVMSTDGSTDGVVTRRINKSPADSMASSMTPPPPYSRPTTADAVKLQPTKCLG